MQSAASSAPVACAAASGQGAVFGQKKRFVNGLEAVQKTPKA
jgi:hypothetical protein